MPYYETVFIARAELGVAQVEKLTEDMSKFIKDGKGKILKTEQWGLRTLAYKINKSRKGHYVLIESDSPAEAILEMERNMRMNEDVMRYMTIKLEQPTEGPSVVMGGGRDSNEDKEAA